MSQIFKQVLSMLDGAPVDDQRIAFLGRQLDGDERPLGSFGIYNDCELTLVIRMRGC